MGGSLKDLVKKINDVGDKTKKIADIVYLFGLVFFLSAEACRSSRVVYVDFVKIFLMVGSAILFITGVYRIFFTLFKNWKLGVLAVAVVIFGFVYSGAAPEATDFTIVAFAIVGAIGVCADHILVIGIVSTFLLIVNNVFMEISGGTDLMFNGMGGNDFFFLGDNVFYFSLMNNCSSTDFASHYMWLAAAFLWYRGYKITWGEIFAIASLDVLIYSFTGSNTTLIGISLLLVFALIIKLWVMFKTNGIADKMGVAGKIANGIKEFFVFCSRLSFLIFAAVTICLAYLYSVDNPITYRLNNILHLRLSLGHRGIVEHGLHLFASGVPIYGMFSSADGYYNFLDCSYISILVVCGILPLAFYLLSMTVIQFRHKKFAYGAVILAVCALSCIEEQHLSEIHLNYFLLLLFADMNLNKKTDLTAPSDKKAIKLEASIKKYANIAGGVVSVLLVFVAVLVNYPRFETVKEFDRLDAKASDIYASIQNNIDKAVSDNSWESKTAALSSLGYGIVMDEPDDYYSVTGSTWASMTKDPKKHAYYTVYYDSANDLSSGNSILNVLITDDVKAKIGSGSVLIEYDVAAGKVYSVWYSDNKGCYEIEGVGARNSSREARLKYDVPNEGYYAGVSEA